MATKNPVNRRTMLRQALTVLGGGVAAAIVGQGAAYAVPPEYTCCLNQDQCTGFTCGAGTKKYRCVPNTACTGSATCGCYDPAHGTCWIKPC